MISWGFVRFHVEINGREYCVMIKGVEPRLARFAADVVIEELERRARSIDEFARLLEEHLRRMGFEVTVDRCWG